MLKYHPDKLAQQEGQKEEAKKEEDAEEKKKEVPEVDLSDINKKAREIIERLINQGKTDGQICKNYQLQEMIEEKRDGMDDLPEKVTRLRRVIEGQTGDETAADQAFKALSQAMSVLSDTQKRRAYDSKDPGSTVDDSLPADKAPKDLADFVKTWAPVFERNCRWCIKQPMPEMSIDSTIEEVLEFYDAWFEFESWRDFTLDIEDAHDPDEAQCREEKRWMERENKKQAEKLKKNENNRMNRMVETAHKWDPRVIAYKEELKNKKKAAKQSRFSKQAEIEAAAKKKAEEEAEEKRKAEEAANALKKDAKAIKEANKRNVRLAKKAFREGCEGLGVTGESMSRVLEVCDNCAMPGDGIFCADDLFALAKRLEGVSLNDAIVVSDEAYATLCAKKGMSAPTASAPAPAAPAPAPAGALRIRTPFHAMFALLLCCRPRLDPKPLYPFLPAQQVSAPKAEKDRKWSRDEVNQLNKALIKYPSGTQERWDKIADFIVSRTAQECQRKCAELKTNFSADAAGMKTDAQVEFARAQAEAAKGHGSRSGTGKKTSGTSVTSVREDGRDAQAVLQEAQMGGGEAAGGDEWSHEQQQALEAAMKHHKSSTLEAKEKWKAIAEMVPGKTDKECIKRLKEIKAMLANK